MITQEKLHELFNYDTTTGNLIWKVGKRKGLVAGCLDKDKYTIIGLEHKWFKAHRLIWIYHGKEFTKPFINHINGIRNDNRIENLEVVTNRENSQKMKKHSQGKLVGCTYHKKHKLWVSQIYTQGKSICLGYFKTEQEAHEKYLNSLKDLQK